MRYSAIIYREMAKLDPTDVLKDVEVSPAIRDLERIDRPVVGFAFDYPSGHRIPRHHHGKAQLIYASRGIMTVTTQAGTWIVPPQRAVWVPARVSHQIAMSGNVSMRTLYLGGDAAAHMPDACCVVTVPDLMRELILAVVAFEQPYPREGREARLVDVLLDELATIPVAPLFVHMPQDKRVQEIVRVLRKDAADPRSLEEWSAQVGASPRTLARIFVKETGLTFGRWRRQLRLLAALEQLAAGASVTSVALSLGYDSPSAFISVFKKHMGATPAQYFAER